MIEKALTAPAFRLAGTLQATVGALKAVVTNLPAVFPGNSLNGT